MHKHLESTTCSNTNSDLTHCILELTGNVPLLLHENMEVTPNLLTTNLSPILPLQWIAAIESGYFQNQEWVGWSDHLQLTLTQHDDWLVELCVAWTPAQALEVLWKALNGFLVFPYQEAKIGFLFKQYQEGRIKTLSALLELADAFQQSIDEDNLVFVQLQEKTKISDEDHPQLLLEIENAFRWYIQLAEQCLNDLSVLSPLQGSVTKP